MAGKTTAMDAPEVVERALVERTFTVEKFAASFGVLVEAAKGVQRLKDVVCELALSGGLSEPHPAESAVVPSGASGNRKTYACSDLGWGGGALPQGWIWTEPQFVGEVAPRNQVDDGLATGFVPMTLVPLEFSGRVTHEVRPWGEIKKGYTHLADGDVGVAKITPCFQNRKSCVIRDLRNGVGAGTTELHVLRPNRRVVEPRFLLLFYRSARFVLEGVARMTGTAGQQRVPVEFFAAAPLPLPPLAEQKRIVARVDQLMALIDQLEAKQNRKREVGARFTKASLEALTTAESPQEFSAAWTRIQSTWPTHIDHPDKVVAIRGAIRNMAIRGALTTHEPHDVPAADLLQRIAVERNRRVLAKEIRRTEPPPAIEDSEVPFPVPSSWAWSRLGNLCMGVADGPHFSPKYVEEDKGVPFLSGRNIRLDGFELDSIKYVSVEDHKIFCDRVKPEPGDILYTKGGTTGIARVNDLDFEFSVWVHVAVLKLDQNNVYPHYVALALNSPHCYEQSQRLTHGIGNRDLGLTRMVNITIPLPPLAEQKRIVVKVEHLIRLCDALEAALRRSEDRAAKLVEAVVQEMAA